LIYKDNKVTQKVTQKPSHSQ